MKQSLGMIEVIGFSTAITIADSMAKVANINILDIKKTNGGGWMSIFIEGDVGAVQAAIQAGDSAAKTVNGFVSSKIIPRPAQQLDVFDIGQKLTEKAIPTTIAEVETEGESISEQTELIEQQPSPSNSEEGETSNSLETGEVTDLVATAEKAETKPKPVTKTKKARTKKK